MVHGMSPLVDQGWYVWCPQCGFEHDLHSCDAELYDLPFDPDGRLD